MTPSIYQQIAAEPKLASFYFGWIGQRIAAGVHAAVLRQNRLAWREACREFQRLLGVLEELLAVKGRNWSTVDSDLAELLDLLTEDGGWWTSPSGFEQQRLDERGQNARDRAIEDALQIQPCVPMLTGEGDGTVVAQDIMAPLGGAVFAAAESTGCLDACRLGVQLAGLCYRITEPISVRVVAGTLDELDALAMASLDTENELRRELGLSELAPDRVWKSPSNEGRPATLPPADALSRSPGRHRPFSSDTAAFPAERLVLAVVFSHFGVDVPPTVSDADLHDIDTICRGIRDRAAAQAFEKMDGGDGATPPVREELPDTLYTEETIEYLGLDRRGLARPEMALQRMVKNGALHPVKVGGRNVYKRKELDRVLREGEPPKRRRRGRPSM